MAKKRKDDKTSSPAALAQQLDAEKRHVESLKAQNRALMARLAAFETHDIEDKAAQRRVRDQRSLLVNMAEAFLLADIAGAALQTSAIDQKPSRSKRDNERPLPGSSTHLARTRANDLRKDVAEALGRFWWSSENDWKRKPHPRANIPKLRCGNRDCGAYDVHIDAWFTVRGGKTVYRERCATCGIPYPREEDAA